MWQGLLALPVLVVRARSRGWHSQRDEGGATFAPLPSLPPIPNSSEPGVCAAVRVAASGERTQCPAGFSHPVPCSLEAFFLPILGRRHKGHQFWRLAVSGTDFPSLLTSVFPTIQLPCGKCGGAEEGQLGTDAGIGGARAQHKELSVLCVKVGGCDMHS